MTALSLRCNSKANEEFERTLEISFSIPLSIVFSSFGIIPLDPEPLLIRTLNRTNISDSAKKRLERKALTYVIHWRHLRC
jgi:hypothetical protein